jgi:hypothetical protein
MVSKFHPLAIKKPQGKRTCGKGSRIVNYKSNLTGGTQRILVFLMMIAMKSLLSIWNYDSVYHIQN